MSESQDKGVEVRGAYRVGRREFLGTAMAAGAGLLGGPLGSIRPAAAADPLKLGWVRPTTGRWASSFAPLYAGGLIAVEEINAAGGIMGRPIARIEEDDEASVAKQPAVIKKLQEQGCSYILGPTGSSQALAAVAVTTPAKIIHGVYGIATALGDGEKYPYAYMCTFNTDQQGEVAATYLAETLKVKKVGILQENTAFGEGTVAASKATLQKYGITPVGTEVVPVNAPDLNAYIGNLRKAGAEGLMIWVSNIPQLAMAFNAMAAIKWFPPTTGHNQLFNESLLELVPADAIQNVYGTALRNFTWSATTTPAARQVAFAKKLQGYPEAKGSEPIVACAPFYDFLYLLKHVVESEKSFDAAAVKRGLDAVKNFPGMQGTINFTPTNHRALSTEALCMATVASGRSPKAMGPFRERAPGA
jgi:ABC-type branched-subunit amino acid transport system substrate-binding protein